MNLLATLQQKSIFLFIDHSKRYACVDIYPLDMYIQIHQSDYKCSDMIEKKALEFVSASFNVFFLN